jgi:hypothetical protein
MMRRANSLSMYLDQRVVLVQDLGRPFRRCHLHQSILCLTSVGALRNKAQPFRHAQMVAIDTNGATTQPAEVHHSRAGLRAHTVELFQPGTDLVSAIPLEKIERKRSTPLRDLL